MFTCRFLLRSVSSRTMVTSSSRAKKASSALRPSASLVVVNSNNEVLLVHRNPNATSFAGMHVRTSAYDRIVATAVGAGAPTRWLIPSWLLRRSSQEETTTRNRMNHIK